MKRLLIVCPLFPPANGADCHRARVLAPCLPDFGWQAEVLAVNPTHLAVPQDPWLANGVGHFPVHRAEALSLKWTKIPGLGTLTHRAKPFLKRLGNRLLRERHFDMVYFSTTSFGLTTLGPLWKKRFGVPYVIDYQDPWITDYYRTNPEVSPPGGRLKYKIVEWLSKREEPGVVRECSGVTAVSPDYPRQLQERYPDFRAPSIVLPFPGSRRDLDRIKSEHVSQSVFDPKDGNFHWVSMGVSGPIMFKVLNSLFQSIANARANGTLPAKLKLHFVGTSYAPPGHGVPVVEPLATKFGLSDMVHEQTDRVPYSTALKCLLDANAIIATGSNDATYNASKLLPYILAERPFLAVFHRDSPASHLLRTLGGATHVEFTEADAEDVIANRIRESWLLNGGHGLRQPLDLHQLERYTDAGQSRQLCAFLDSLLVSSETLK
jgi:hypothetical protein